MRAKERIYLFTFLLSFCTFIISPSILVFLEDDQDIAYFFNVTEEEENKEEGKEKEMNENFLLHFHDMEMLCFYPDISVFFHIQEKEEDVFHVPVLPPPERIS